MTESAKTPRTQELVCLDSFGLPHITDLIAVAAMEEELNGWSRNWHAMISRAEKAESALTSLTAERDRLRDELATSKGLHTELREFHTACITEFYRMLGVDGSDGEIRFKWAALELASKLRELAACRVDKERLDWLEKQSLPGMKWCARNSTTGRGYRLHQDPYLGTHETVRAALDRAAQEKAG